MNNYPELALPILIAAKAKINKGWCQKSAAESLFGFEVKSTSFWANKWCAWGALVAASEKIDNMERAYADYWLQAALNATAPDYTSYIRYNDAPGRTKKEVLALFDKAIELAQKDITKHVD